MASGSPPRTLPPSVRAIRRARRFLSRRRRAVAAAVATLATIVALSRAIYTVANGESAAVLRFGRLVDDAVGPGLHVRLPAGADRVTKVRTGEVLRLPIEGDVAPALDLLTGDENLVAASLVVQYRVSRLGSYLYAVEDPALLLRQVVRSALLEAVASTHVEELLTSGKAAVQNQVRSRAQRKLDAYGAGIALVAVNLQSLNPPGEAATAFRAVSDAQADAAQAVSRAEAESERSLRLARGEAQQLLEQAQATAHARFEQASGATERFERLRQASRRSPGLARADLRAAAAARALPRVRIIVLAPGEPPRIDLHRLESGPQGIVRSGSDAAASPPDHDR